MIELSKRWMKKAEKDLSDAKFNLKHNKFEVASFLSHQAAEKSLKALYISHFNELLRIHDLAELGKRLGMKRNLLKACDALNPHYIETRYIIDVEYTKKMAQDAFKNCQKVLKWAKKELPKK